MPLFTFRKLKPGSLEPEPDSVEQYGHTCGGLCTHTPEEIAELENDLDRQLRAGLKRRKIFGFDK